MKYLKNEVHITVEQGFNYTLSKYSGSDPTLGTYASFINQTE
jgi:hypothetical protein